MKKSLFAWFGSTFVIIWAFALNLLKLMRDRFGIIKIITKPVNSGKLVEVMEQVGLFLTDVVVLQLNSFTNRLLVGVCGQVKRGGVSQH